MDTIVLCAVFRDAAAHILEWIAFHRLIGVDRFVLYDQGSADGTAALIARSRFARQVTLIAWPQDKTRPDAYADFAANHARDFTWSILLDPNEFIHPLETDTIRTLLPRYEGFAAVVLRRLTFGGLARPGQFLIDANTSHIPGDAANDAAPTLLRSANFLGANGTPPGLAVVGAACNARGERVDNGQACDDVMVVNRYRSGSEAQATLPDRRMARFVPRLRALLHDAPPATAPRTAPPGTGPTPAAAQAASPAAAQPLLLGIGISTYNRQSVLSQTLDRVQQHTRHPRTIVAVADDGSEDGTLDMLRARQVLTVTGRNTGVAWNKNRALFLLAGILRCDVVILLEDDAYPTRDNWQAEWIQAAIRWGHVNVAADWLREHFLSGTGTLEDPIISHHLTAQCAVFSRESLLFGGYFDTRFRGYGHEHVEHTWRLLRMGYGGSDWTPDSKTSPLFKLIWGGIAHHSVPTVGEPGEWQAERNRVLAQLLLGEYSYRAPYQNEEEARQLREEMRRSFPRPVL